MSRPADSLDCFNCGTPLTGPFCAACGQRAVSLNPTLRDVLREATHELLNVDGRIFRSVRTLLFAPGYLTREHLEGRRTRWVPPLRLYLVFSLIYFGVASLGASHLRIETTGTDRETAEGLQRLGFESEQELRETVGHAQQVWAPRLMFVLVPLFAWLVHVAFRRSGRNYPQHLYFALHVHAALFAMGAVAAGIGLLGTGIVWTALTVVVVVYSAVYFVLAFRAVYGGPLRGVILRAAFVGVAYYLLVITATLAVVLPILFRAASR